MNQPLFNLDRVLCDLDPNDRARITPKLCYAANPDCCPELRWYGFEVPVAIAVWREHLLPHVQALLDGPVLLFGQPLRCYGWFASILPTVPIQSADQAVWLNFYEPTYYDAWLARHKLAGHNNLTCAPGVRALLGRG